MASSNSGIRLAGRPQAQRGSTFILVLALLSVLTLIAIALSYSSRLESAASLNYAQLTEARSAAATGLPVAVPLLARGMVATNASQPWVKVPDALYQAAYRTGAGAAGNPRAGTADSRVALPASAQLGTSAGKNLASALSGSGIPLSLAEDGSIHGLPPAVIGTTDLSSRVNINAIQRPEVLARYLVAAFAASSEEEARTGAARATGTSGGSSGKAAAATRRENKAASAQQRALQWRGEATPVAIAQAVLQFRNIPQSGAPAPAGRAPGSIGAALPAPAGSSQPQAAAAPAPPIATQGRVIRTLADLKLREHREKGAPAATSEQSSLAYSGVFSDDEIRKLNKLVTVFSQAPELYLQADGTSGSQLSMQQCATEPNRLYNALARAFPEKDLALLAQFACNVADFADADSIPHSLRVTARGGSAAPWALVIGSEMAPLITEVYPDSKTSRRDGDQGQFIELRNVWPQPLDVNGWQLSVNGGSRIGLQGAIAPGGALIVTDNYDQPAEGAEPGTGAFLSVFGARKDGSLRRVQAEANLSLPDQNAYVALYDARGNLIDAFAWADGAGREGKQSYQRVDPRVRQSVIAEATPFLPSASERTSAGAAAAMAAATLSDSARAFERYGNRGFLASPADLLLVSTSYAVSLDEPGTAILDERAADQASALRRARAAGTAYFQSPLLSRAARTDAVGQLLPMQQKNFDLSIVNPFTALPPAAVVEGQLAGAAPGGVNGARPMGAGPGEESGPSTAGTRPRRPRSAASVVDGTTPASGGDGAAGAIAATLPRTAAEAAARGLDPALLDAPLPVDALGSTRTLYSQGKLNLNTCDPVALWALDVPVSDTITTGGPDFINEAVISQFNAYRAQQEALSRVPFANSADIILAFLPQPQPAHLPIMRALLQQTTPNSSSFEVRAENRVAPGSGSTRAPVVARARWVVSLDRAPYRVLQYEMTP